MGQCLNESVLSEQVNRLRTIPFSPEDDDQVEAITREMKTVLRRVAKSDDHCRRIMDRLILEEAQKFPAPATVMAVAREVPEIEATTAPAGCGACGGLGYRHVERQGFNRGTQEIELMSAVEFCSCEKGQWLSRKSRERAGVVT